MDLINPFAKKSQKAEPTTGLPASAFESSIRLDVLLICLDETRQFCEGFLAIPEDEYCNLSFVQWSALIFATVIMYKLSIGVSHIPEWDARAARNVFDMEMFLETVSGRMINVSHGSAAPLGRKDLYSMMGLIFANVKRTYDRLKNLPQSHSASDKNPVHATSFPDTPVSENLDAKPSYQHRCPAFPFWKSQGSDVTMFGGVEGLAGSATVATSVTGEDFTGINFADENEFMDALNWQEVARHGEWNVPGV